MEKQILDYIKENFGAQLGALSSEDDLLTSGLIDSMGIIKLIGFLQEEYGVKIPPEEMVIENFINVKSIIEYITRINEADDLSV